MTPTVSILIPTFNQELRFLKECIDSVLRQTFNDIEIIVSNNHSTNGTLEFLRGYSDERLKIVSPVTFLSMNENFAFCATHARGKYISFLSSDDFLMPHAIQELHEQMEANSDAAFAFGNIYHARKVPSKSNKEKFLLRPYGEGFRVYTAKQATEFFFPWTVACTWMAGDIIRRDAYEKTGGFLNCDLLTTGDVWLTKALIQHGGIVCLEEPLALFRTRSIIRPEVDRDRRILDFADVLTFGPKGGRASFSKLTRIRQKMSLIYRLGSPPKPSTEAILTARRLFGEAGRDDLTWLIDLYRSSDTTFRILGALMLGMDISRKAIQRARNYVRNMANRSGS